MEIFGNIWKYMEIFGNIFIIRNDIFYCIFLLLLIMVIKNKLKKLKKENKKVCGEKIFLKTPKY